MTDTEEHIYLAYWQGNDAVKGREFAELEPVTLEAVAQNVFNGAQPRIKDTSAENANCPLTSPSRWRNIITYPSIISQA